VQTIKKVYRICANIKHKLLLIKEHIVLDFHPPQVYTDTRVNAILGK